MKRVLLSRISFFENTSPGRILNRFSGDTQSIDNNIPFQTNIFLKNFFLVWGSLFVIAIEIPNLIFVLIIIIFMVYYIIGDYRHVSREI
jgi:ATP-binding cassette subfamily C (CFTR/MRP) protein 1